MGGGGGWPPPPRAPRPTRAPPTALPPRPCAPAVALNLIVAVVVTAVLRAMKVPDGVDGTEDTDYTAEREDPTFRELPDPLESEPRGAAEEGVRRG